MALKGTKVGAGPSMGSVPKGKASAGRTVDHPNMGRPASGGSSANNAGKECKSVRESGKKVKTPSTKCYAQGPGQRKSAG